MSKCLQGFAIVEYIDNLFIILRVHEYSDNLMFNSKERQLAS